MANTKTTALTENTAPLGSDLLYWVDDPAGTPASHKIYGGTLNLLPEGWMVNGKIAVTVSSNNITLALKTKSGGNPSTTDPVSVWINGSFRRCTAALSVTKNAGTNWCNSGGAELATLESDYFAYLIWNTTPATDIMDIGFARMSHGRVYSDFSGTTTNEKYLAYANASAPTSTDSCVVIGRFAATLSAGAGYTWSVPSYTNSNLIQFPIFETRWLDWTPAYTASAGTYGTVTTTIASYRVSGPTVFAYIYSNGTLSGTPLSARFSLPFTASTATAQVIGDGANSTTGKQLYLYLVSTTVCGAVHYDASNWPTGANAIVNGSFSYEY